MKSRPILFTGAMVRALLDGSKTQTRRAAKLTDAGYIKEVGGHRRWHPADPNAVKACPYGQPGDQLWVRETWARTKIHQDHTERDWFVYPVCDNTTDYGGPWKPSIHMPRTASRITLEITAVRMERLQDISRGDAMAEGCPFPNLAQGDDPRKWYADLWNAINGPDSYAANPWVWVVEFKVIQK